MKYLSEEKVIGCCDGITRIFARVIAINESQHWINDKPEIWEFNFDQTDITR